MSEVFDLDNLLARRDQGGRSYIEFLRVPAMSAGIYILPAGGTDLQRPHEQDEIYHVLMGAAKMRLGSTEKKISQGDVIFVERNAEHRFFDIEEELVLLVVFAPAES